ncbi:hypothetical protein K432DRAFT_286107 [Lepidopterella palustris CBS 459.81]|uniref:Uncharacterized protein n=1 Tax=Lepidopterella palustris CBS 459.81 TaxID=1314670 RepID=A0A8E2EKN0_9PEZI|nr:hypothetical protein K432DRAFT_286107 [Lepidopterella palustris CBS 459.81]
MASLPVFEPVHLPWERRPAEFIPGHGWYQGGNRRHGVKPHYAFIWPKDGKRGTTLGRWKDIIHGTGPDIHISISADKKDHMHNRQRRARWAKWTHLDDRGPDGALRDPVWARKPKRYDFRTRKYCYPCSRTWTDARWGDEPNDHFPFPYAIRDTLGQWWQDIP